MLGDYGDWAERRDRRREPRNEREAHTSLRAALKREAERELRYQRARKLWEK